MAEKARELKEFETIIKLFASGDVEDTYSIVLQYYADGHLYHDFWKEIKWKFDTVLSLIRVLQQYEHSNIQIYIKSVWLIYQILFYGNSIHSSDFTVAIQEELISILMTSSMIHKNYVQSLQLLELLITKYDFPFEKLYLIGFRLVGALPSIIHEHNYIAILTFSNNMFLKTLNTVLSSSANSIHMLENNPEYSLPLEVIEYIVSNDSKFPRQQVQKETDQLQQEHCLVTVYTIMMEYLLTLYCGINDDCDANYFLTKTISTFSFGTHLLFLLPTLSVETSEAMKKKQLCEKAALVTISLLRQLCTKQLKNVYSILVHHFIQPMNHLIDENQTQSTSKEEETKKKVTYHSIPEACLVAIFQAEETKCLPSHATTITTNNNKSQRNPTNYILIRELFKFIMICCREELFYQQCVTVFFVSSRCACLLSLYTKAFSSYNATMLRDKNSDQDSSSSSSCVTNEDITHFHDEFLLYDVLLEWYLVLYISQFPFHNQQYHYLFTTVSPTSDTSVDEANAPEDKHIQYILTLWKSYLAYLHHFPFYPLPIYSHPHKVEQDDDDDDEEEEDKEWKLFEHEQQFIQKQSYHRLLLESIYRFCYILESTFQICSDLTIGMTNHHHLHAANQPKPTVPKPSDSHHQSGHSSAHAHLQAKVHYEILSIKYDIVQTLLLPFFTSAIDATTLTSADTSIPTDTILQNSINPLDWDITYHYVLDLLVLFYSGVGLCWQSPHLAILSAFGIDRNGSMNKNMNGHSNAIGKGGLKGEFDRDYNLIHLPSYYRKQLIDITNIRLFDDNGQNIPVGGTRNATTKAANAVHASSTNNHPEEGVYVSNRRRTTSQTNGMNGTTTTTVPAVSFTNDTERNPKYLTEKKLEKMRKDLEVAWYDVWMILLQSIFVHFTVLEDLVIHWDYMVPSSSSSNNPGAFYYTRNQKLSYLYVIVSVLSPQYASELSNELSLHILDFPKLYNLLYQYYLLITGLQPSTSTNNSNNANSNKSGKPLPLTSQRSNNAIATKKTIPPCFGIERKVLQIFTALMFDPNQGLGGGNSSSSAGGVNSCASAFHYYFPLSEHLYYQLLLPSYLRYKMIPTSSTTIAITTEQGEKSDQRVGRSTTINPYHNSVAEKLFDLNNTNTETKSHKHPHQDRNTSAHSSSSLSTLSYLNQKFNHFHKNYLPPPSSAGSTSSTTSSSSSSLPTSPFGLNNMSQTGIVPDGAIRKYYYALSSPLETFMFDQYVDSNTILLSCFLSLLQQDSTLVRKYINKYPIIMNNWHYFAPILTPTSSSIGYTTSSLSLRPLMHCQKLFERVYSKLEMYFERYVVEYVLKLMNPYQVCYHDAAFEQLRSLATILATPPGSSSSTAYTTSEGSLSPSGSLTPTTASGGKFSTKQLQQQLHFQQQQALQQTQYTQLTKRIVPRASAVIITSAEEVVSSEPPIKWKKSVWKVASVEVKIYIGEWVYSLGNEHPGLIYRGFSRPEIEETFFSWLLEELQLSPMLSIHGSSITASSIASNGIKKRIPSYLGLASTGTSTSSLQEMDKETPPETPKVTTDSNIPVTDNTPQTTTTAAVLYYKNPQIILSCMKAICMIAHNINTKPMYQTSARLFHYSIYYQYQQSSYAHRSLLHPRSIQWMLATLYYTYFPSPFVSTPPPTATSTTNVHTQQQNELLSYRLIYMHYIMQWSNAILSTLLDNMITPIHRHDITQINQLKDQLLHHLIPYIPIMMEFIITTKRHPRPGLSQVSTEVEGPAGAEALKIVEEEVRPIQPNTNNNLPTVVQETEVDKKKRKKRVKKLVKVVVVEEDENVLQAVPLRSISSAGKSGVQEDGTGWLTYYGEEEDEKVMSPLSSSFLDVHVDSDSGSGKEDTKQGISRGTSHNTTTTGNSDTAESTDQFLSVRKAVSSEENVDVSEEVVMNGNTTATHEDEFEDDGEYENDDDDDEEDNVADDLEDIATETWNKRIYTLAEVVMIAINTRDMNYPIQIEFIHATGGAASAANTTENSASNTPANRSRYDSSMVMARMNSNQSYSSYPEFPTSPGGAGRHQTRSDHSGHHLTSLQSAHELLLYSVFYSQQRQLSSNTNTLPTIVVEENNTRVEIDKINSSSNVQDAEEESRKASGGIDVKGLLPSPSLPSHHPFFPVINPTQTKQISFEELAVLQRKPSITSPSTQPHHPIIPIPATTMMTFHIPNELSTQQVIETFTETLFTTIYLYFCTDNIFPLSSYLQYKSLFQQIPLITSLSYFMICYKKNLIILRKGLEIIAHFAYHELNISSIAMHSPLGLYYVMKSSLGSLPDIQLLFVMTIYAMILPGSNTSNGNSSNGAGNSTGGGNGNHHSTNSVPVHHHSHAYNKHATMIVGGGNGSGQGVNIPTPTNTPNTSSRHTGTASTTTGTTSTTTGTAGTASSTTSSTLLMSYTTTPASNLLLNEANEFAKDNFFRFELHYYVVAIFGNLVTLYAPPPPMVTGESPSNPTEHSSSSSGNTSGSSHRSTRRRSLMTGSSSGGNGSGHTGTSASSMMIHAGSSGNTWYTSSQLEMITYMFFVVYTLATTDMNMLQFCSKTPLIIQLIQWLDITTPINLPPSTGNHHHTTAPSSGSSGGGSSSSTGGGGNASLTMVQLCTIYLKLHFLALRILIAIDITVPELIESSEYRGYISTVMKKTKKSIVALLKFFSSHASTVSASCVGSTVSSGMAMAGGNSGLSSAHMGGGNPTSAYKAITHQRYLYVLDSISLSEIEDLVNDDKIAILKDSCSIS